MQQLQVLIEHLTKGRKIHISILDLCGISDAPLLDVNFKNVIHSKNFCNLAKATEKGYRACIRCKMLANTKAAEKKKAFCGYCIYGLYEAAVPVETNGTVLAIVYVGNAVIDKEKALERIDRTCRFTGVDSRGLHKELEECEKIDDACELIQIAEIVKDYIKMIINSIPKKKSEGHWLVSVMKNYAKEMYCDGILLKELAITYQKNEKYIGRLFKKETGVSFNEYCMELRLEKAENLLRTSDDKIIDIAMECGFNNISYFNRVFHKKHGISPKSYRSL